MIVYFQVQKSSKQFGGDKRASGAVSSGTLAYEANRKKMLEQRLLIRKAELLASMQGGTTRALSCKLLF